MVPAEFTTTVTSADNDDNPATSCLEGVTHLNFSKQDSVDEAITRCTMVDLLSDSGGLACAAKLPGSHQQGALLGRTFTAAQWPKRFKRLV